MVYYSDPDSSTSEKFLIISSYVNCEVCSLIDDLPNPKAVVDLYELVVLQYGVDFVDGIYESIEEGEDPKQFVDFIKLYDLNWRIPGESDEDMDKRLNEKGVEFEAGRSLNNPTCK